MAGIVINISTTRLDQAEFEDVCTQTFDFLVELSPVDTGFFASQWEMDLNYPTCRFSNDTPYGEYLDRGWSNQAPDGMTRPALAFLADLVS